MERRGGVAGEELGSEPRCCGAWGRGGREEGVAGYSEEQGSCHAFRAEDGACGAAVSRSVAGVVCQMGLGWVIDRISRPDSDRSISMGLARPDGLSMRGPQ